MKILSFFIYLFVCFIRIEVQRQTNDALRKIAYKCLSIKLEDSRMYSEFAKTIRDMYVNILKEQLALEQEKNKVDSTEKQDEAMSEHGH